MSGPIFWIDCQNESSLVKDASGIVTQWRDTSGNGRHVNKIEGSPTTVTSIPATGSRRTCIFFNRARMSTDPFPNSINLTVAIVGAVGDSPAGWGTFWGQWDGGAHDTYISMRISEWNSPAGPAGTTLNFHTMNDNTQCNLPFTKNTLTLWIGTMRNGNELYFESTPLNTLVTSSVRMTYGGSSILTGSFPLHVGSSTVGNYSNSYLGEVVYYNRVLSTDEIENLRNSLISKWFYIP